MAELAFGAVRSLLGLLQEEAQQLTRVGDDVRFIQEEMESMASFLQHLAETTPPDGEHRAPVRTWMKQVRDVAFDCSNCVDHYVRKGRGHLVARDSGGLMGFLRSLPCSMSLGAAVVARRDASDQIKLLKDRVREVSERRQRYGVELPELVENNDRRQGDLMSLAPMQQPTFIIQFPVPEMKMTDGNMGSGGTEVERGGDQPSVLTNMNDGRVIPISGGTTEAMVPAALGSSKDAVSVGTEAAGLSSQTGGDKGGEDGSRARPNMVKSEDKVQLTFTTQLPKLKINGSPDLVSGGTEVAGSSTETLGDDGGDDNSGARPTMAVSDDFIRATLGFSEPNILEENKTKLVDLLMRQHHHVCMGEPGGHDGNHEEEATATKLEGAQLLPSPRLLSNVICVAAPNKKDGGALVQKVLGDPAVAKTFQKLVRPQLDLVFLSLVPKENRLWHILRFLLDNLLPEEAPNEGSMREKDKWDEAKIAREIRKELKGVKSLFIIEGDVVSMDLWDLIKEALGKIGCTAGITLIVMVTDTANANEIRRKQGVSDSWPLVTHSLADYWYAKALAVLDRSRLKTGYLRQNMRQILCHILGSCEPKAFCTKVFVHYLCANPSRSKEELDELLIRTLVSTDRLLPEGIDASEIREANGKKLLMFCYRDLPREYRSCLLYLAIFPTGRTIWRSRLVMRWIVEGLITGRDMRRAVLKAEHCFDTLVNRGFVRPTEIGAARKVKSCTVHHKLILGLISNGAKEEQFLHPRLSSHLAQHFSVHGDLQLRRSDTIQDFMLSLGKKSGSSSNRSVVYQPQLSLIKVLDLEECKHLKNPVPGKDFKKMLRQCLNNICSNLLLLKYLSVRNTDVDSLPKKINNLLHLEILDIRQTKVPSDGTKHIALPKLKCLLAGHTQTKTSTMSEKPVPCVMIPSKISTMPNMEVLSHVNASRGDDVLKHVGHLWQLRKLGVVIDGNLKDWLKAIGDLNECLRSLSIHIDSLNPNDEAIAAEINTDASFHLELLERLSVSGSPSKVLLPLFFKDGHHNLISKVTLRDTSLDHSTLEAHLKKLPNLQRIKLRYNSYTETELTFNPHVFPKLKFLIVECRMITRINFHVDAAPKLEKIVWSSTKMDALSGITNLPVLQELVLKVKGDESNNVLVQVRKDIAAHQNFPAPSLVINNPPQDMINAEG